MSRVKKPRWNEPTQPLSGCDLATPKDFFEGLKPLMDTMVSLAREMPDLQPQIEALAIAPILNIMRIERLIDNIMISLQPYLGLRSLLEADPQTDLELRLILRQQLIDFLAADAYENSQRIGRVLDDAGYGVRVVRERQRGGMQQREKTNACHAEWRKMALELRKKHPTWSKTDIARQIKKDTAYSSNYHTIRNRIRDLV